MKTDSEIIDAGFQALFSSLSRVDAERFIMLIKREQFDYTHWQTKLWKNETVESLSKKAQKAWELN
ncbi:hypothetical protein [Methylotuvimicrobium alcaliphilum]|uniref:Uncharacterized protein n=1 Tax=Methylotuvimicrobium alcaliphilum (strain DSM 19304 / NCIMB 14124 / VKM B-2133 / 20Z) TaxID=1091494 RepID=G4T428_META2|nr:hypothetical protein [Methylotuvimicrobium alcaliphilum]CCE23763.1 conserved protein of unknown function [Methylotuvimicrobium alcaliphilum 20Z]